MNNNEAKHLSNYLKEEITRIRNDLNFLLQRINEAEEKYKINKQQTKIEKAWKSGKS